MASTEHQLLELYRENSRLKSIQDQQEKELEKELEEFQQQHRGLLELCKEEQLQHLEELSRVELTLQQKRGQFQKAMSFERQEEDEENGQCKAYMSMQVQLELQAQEQQKEQSLGRQGQLAKQIHLFKQRIMEFENLIGETKLEIEQLEQDQLQAR